MWYGSRVRFPTRGVPYSRGLPRMVNCAEHRHAAWARALAGDVVRELEVPTDDADRVVAGWGMDSEGAPLFQEYLRLCAANGWDDLMPDVDSIGQEDALIVVDMQNDFVPKDETNTQEELRNLDGGRFGVAEGAMTCGHIVEMMRLFKAAGASVVATRDYHPDGHCSFWSKGGPFPPHCVQGSGGGVFLKCSNSAVDVNAPPDVLAVYERKRLGEML